MITSSLLDEKSITISDMDKKLYKIKINGYKSIKNCEIDLKDINVLIGSNGAGKSNFISAFKFLQAIIDQELGIFASTNGLSSLFYDGLKVTDKIDMEFFFGYNSYGFSLIPSNDNKLIFDSEFLSYNNVATFSRTSPYGRGHSESLWRNGVGNNMDLYANSVFENISWRVYHFHDTSSNARVKQSHKVINNVMFQQDAGNLAAFLLRLRNNYPKHYQSITSTIRTIAPFFSDFILVPNDDNESIVLKWRERGCDDAFGVSQLSDGTLRFICLATLLLQPVELMPTTIIIDEPELGLHPFAIYIFSELVKSVSKKKQIIISTQSVELLNYFEPEDVIVVDNKKDQGSSFKRLSSEELKGWLDLDYSLGDLWNKNVFGGRTNL